MILQEYSTIHLKVFRVVDVYSEYNKISLFFSDNFGAFEILSKSHRVVGIEYNTLTAVVATMSYPDSISSIIINRFKCIHFKIMQNFVQ